MTKTKLAKELGISRSTLYEYLQFPDHPKEMTVEAWQPFVDEVRSNPDDILEPIDPGDENIVNESSRERYHLARAKKTEWAAKREEHRYKQEAGLLVPQGQFVGMLKETIFAWRRELNDLDSKLPPLLLGLDAPDIQLVLRKHIDAVLHKAAGYIDGVAAEYKKITREYAETYLANKYGHNAEEVQPNA